jgi:diphosphomevalonate decarboxylase
MKASAVANANIALVKYWGKRNDALILPQNSNVSVTLDGLTATTTVEFDAKYGKDIFILDGKEQSGEELERVVAILNILRKKAGINYSAKVASENNFPTAAGFASSAAGGAALALAASKAAGLSLDEKELSILARINSGSASRSIAGGFVEWAKGKKDDGSDSYGVQIAGKEHWPEFRILACVLSTEKKKIKSRAGMKQSVANSPFYSAWRDTAEQDTQKMKELIKKKNFTEVGKLAEHNCLKMHATMMTTTPAIIYWNEKTVELMHAIMNWRDEGLELYFTIDAGPQIKIICLAKNVAEITKRVKALGVDQVMECKPGDNAKLINKHLF